VNGKLSRIRSSSSGDDIVKAAMEDYPRIRRVFDRDDWVIEGLESESEGDEEEEEEREEGGGGLHFY